MIAILRPDSWNLPLFLHVLGAVTLFGAMVATTTLIAASRTRRELAPLFARYAFRTWVALVVPAFLLMRLVAEWLLSREKDQIPKLGDKGWVGVGFIVGDFGAIVLLALGITAWWNARRGGTSKAGTAALILGGVYLAALAVAWFAMSAKPGA